MLPAEISEREQQELRFHALRALARTDGVDAVYAYGEYVFDYVPAEHHRRMVEEVLDAILHRKPIVILEPRGAAKSSWVTTILVSWLIAKYPDIRVGMISNTQLQAEAFSRAIKITYESNERHRELFGDCVSPKKWTDKQWLHRDSRWHGSKDVSLFAVGVLGAIISKRFDLIVADDILDEENTANVEQREKVATWWWKTLTPCLAPGGAQVVIGTRWSEDDHYERLTKPRDEGGKGWSSLVQKALLDDGNGRYTSYWPEYWSVEQLLELKEDMGTPLFSCAYQNDISGLLEGNIFKGPFDHFATLPEGHSYSLKMGIDLASSEKERADYTARVTTAEDVCPATVDCSQRSHYFILSAYRDKRETAHAEFVRDGWQAYPDISLVIVESQQFQSTLIQTVMEDYPFIPIEGKSADVDKTTRARAVAAKFEAHRVHIQQQLRGSALETELLSFPKGHDDMVDALGYSMDLAGMSFAFVAARR